MGRRQKESMSAQDRLARMWHNGPNDRPLSRMGSAGWDAKGRGSEEVLSLLPRFEQAKRGVLHLWNELRLLQCKQNSSWCSSSNP